LSGSTKYVKIKKSKFGNSEKTAKNVSILASNNWISFKVTTLTLKNDLDIYPF
jgi:hypothetical protein